MQLYRLPSTLAIKSTIMTGKTAVDDCLVNLGSVLAGLNHVAYIIKDLSIVAKGKDAFIHHISSRA
jgi:hypothetical protein